LNLSAGADQLNVQRKSDAGHITASDVISVTSVHTAVDMAGTSIKQPVVFMFFD
jgi:uncharacterized protein (DUF2345 family)